MISISENIRPRPGQPDEAKQVAKQIEGMFFKMLLSEMRKGLPEGGFLGGGATGNMFGSLFDEAIAEKASAGMNLGVADAMLAQLGGSGNPTAGQPSGSHWPLAGKLTSAYGLRADPFTGQPAFHHGLDIAAAAGTPIASMSSGVVIQAGSAEGLGNTVRVRVDPSTEIIYGHCGKLRVRPGQQVHQGETVGEVGQTGRATGPHLHLEVRRQGQSLDPRAWMNRTTVSPTGARGE